MISVLDGGEGSESAGRLFRSRERFGEWRRDDNDPDEERDLGGVDMLAVIISVLCDLTNMLTNLLLLYGLQSLFVR